MKVHAFSIDLKDLKTHIGEYEFEEYDEEMTEYASYEEWEGGSSVYAESLVSAERARSLVLNFCLKFVAAVEELQKCNQ